MGEQNTKWTFYVYQQFFHSGWSLRRYLTIKVGSIQYFNLHVHCKKFNYNATTFNCTICMIQFQKIMFQLLCAMERHQNFPILRKKGLNPFVCNASQIVHPILQGTTTWLQSPLNAYCAEVGRRVISYCYLTFLDCNLQLSLGLLAFLSTLLNSR